MKYFIITLVIGAILTLLAYFFDFTNNKNDKYFLIFVSVILILSGLFYSIKYEVSKDKDETEKVAKIDTTLVNTEKLKTKADSIITNLNESLDKTLTLSDSINSQNLTLDSLESDIKKQIKTLNKTLTQTKVFQKMIDEQNQREIAQFERDSAKIQIYSNDVKFLSALKDSTYRLKIFIRNSGARTAINVKANYNLLLTEKNKNNFLDEPKLDYIELNPVLGNNYDKNYFGYIERRRIFTIEELKNNFKSAYLVIRILYEDESNKKTIEENFFFFWAGYDENKLEFHLLSNTNKKTNFIQKIKDSGYSYLLTEKNK